jgi:hypothetical protein
MRWLLEISNPFGTNIVQVALSLVDLKMFAGLIISGPGGRYKIQAVDSISGTNNWLLLDTKTVTREQMPFYFFDTNSPAFPTRFYRAIWEPQIE